MNKRFLDVNDVRSCLIRAIWRAGNQAEFARRNGINRPYLNRFLTGHETPGAQILAALNLKKVRPLSTTDVRRLLRQEVQLAGSQAEWARRMGLDRTRLNRVMCGKSRPSSPIFKALKLPSFLYCHL